MRCFQAVLQWSIHIYIYTHLHSSYSDIEIHLYIHAGSFVPGYIVEGFDPDTKDNTSSDRLQSHWNVFILQYMCTPLKKTFAAIFSRWSQKNKTSCTSIKLLPATTFMLEQLRTQCCLSKISIQNTTHVDCLLISSIFKLYLPINKVSGFRPISVNFAQARCWKNA